MCLNPFVLIAYQGRDLQHTSMLLMEESASVDIGGMLKTCYILF